MKDSIFHKAVLRPKDVDGMTKSVNRYQTAPVGEV